MNTILLILFIVSYILTGLALMGWKLSVMAAKREAIKRMQEWNDLISNELLKGNHTQTEIAQFIMKRSELLESELPENEFVDKWQTRFIRLKNVWLKIKLFFKKIRNKFLYFYFKHKIKPTDS